MTVKVRAGEWVSHTLRISPVRFMRFIEEAKKHVSKVTFSSVFHGTGIPKLSDYQPGVGKKEQMGSRHQLPPRIGLRWFFPGLSPLNCLQRTSGSSMRRLEHGLPNILLRLHFSYLLYQVS